MESLYDDGVMCWWARRETHGHQTTCPPEVTEVLENAAVFSEAFFLVFHVVQANVRVVFPEKQSYIYSLINSQNQNLHG